MYAQQLESELLEIGLFVLSVKEIDYGQQIRLGCGAIVAVYDKGTVLVQGKLHPESREDSLMKLKRVLPRETRWCLK